MKQQVGEAFFAKQKTRGKLRKYRETYLLILVQIFIMKVIN